MTDIAKRAQEVGFHRAALEAGALITDGPLPDDFVSAWGKAPFTGGRSVAHHWTAERPEWRAPEVLYGATSACGLTTIGTAQVPLFSAGNYPYCARCEAVLMKQMRSRIAAKNKIVFGG